MTGVICPTYQSGFYSPQRGGRPKYPSLWSGRVFAFCPLLGQTGFRLPDFGFRRVHGTLSVMDSTLNYAVNGGYHSIELNGTTGVVTATNTVNILNAVSSATYEAWVYPRSAGGGNGGAIWRCDGASNSYFVMNSLGRYTAVVGDTNINSDLSVLDYTKRVHLCMIWDGANIRLYKDGILDANSPVAKTGTLTMHTALRIGNNSGGIRGFDGWIFETSIYNRAISRDELQILRRRPGISYELNRRVSRKAPAAVPSTRRRQMLHCL